MIEGIVDFLQENNDIEPEIGIICGSGLGSLADKLTDTKSYPYDTIPNFPASTVEGHSGELIFGNLEDVPCVVMKGRFHAYEGYPLWLCAMPVRVMKLLGVELLIVTNAAGGVNPTFKAGDLMLIKDHINIPGFAGNNPLRGSNDERFGPRFPPMNRAYDVKHRVKVKELAKKIGIGDLREGIYCMFGGPCYETVAEVKFIRQIGGDAVGMSTVHEVITAKHCGLEVLALSLITNMCIADENDQSQANHEEVVAVGKKRSADLLKLISAFVASRKK